MSDGRPKVTIGIPVRNGAKTLPRVIDLMLAQDYSDFELIISDNASEDNTYELCLGYAGQDRRVRVFRSESNLGLVPNFNRLVGLAEGEYFKWNSDNDWCAPSFLSRCVEALDADPSVVVAYPRTVIVDDNGDYVREFDDPADASSPDPVERYRTLFENLVLSNMVFGVVRTEALRKTRLFPSYRRGHRAMVMELALQGRFELLPEPLFFRRLPSNPVVRGRRWLDPSGNRVGPDRFNIYYDYLTGVLRSDLGVREKVQIASTVCGRFLMPRKLRQQLGVARRAMPLPQKE